MKDDTDKFTLKEAAKFVPYSAEYLNLLVRNRKIKGWKKGRKWIVSRQTLYNYLEKQQKQLQKRKEDIGAAIIGLIYKIRDL